MARLAVVLFNLGGPDSLDAVEPFLFNLFNDPAIIGGPGLFRRLLAKFISRRRGPEARKIYQKIGGKSPLLEETEAQARALTRHLAGNIGDGEEVRVFTAMRYWHPMSDDVAREVKSFGPDRAVLLPLYPQHSTTTTASSLGDWRRAAARAGLDVPSRAVCCYPAAPELIRAQAALIRPALKEAKETAPPRLLFSAHGLPEKVIAGGDPYQWQVERTSAAVAAALGLADADWTVCYQSRVGPLKWIGPSIADELRRAGKDRVAVVVVPIAFVSEHSETLVELDIQYRDMAHDENVPAYIRVPALGVQDDFISGLARIVRETDERDGVLCSAEGPRQCPAEQGKCPLSGSGE
jgi:ferrochelatase